MEHLGLTRPGIRYSELESEFETIITALVLLSIRPWLQCAIRLDID
jgi:hypothetical protein